MEIIWLFVQNIQWTNCIFQNVLIVNLKLLYILHLSYKLISNDTLLIQNHQSLTTILLI